MPHSLVSPSTQVTVYNNIHQCQLFIIHHWQSQENNVIVTVKPLYFTAIKFCRSIKFLTWLWSKTSCIIAVRWTHVQDLDYQTVDTTLKFDVVQLTPWSGLPAPLNIFFWQLSEGHIGSSYYQYRTLVTCSTDILSFHILFISLKTTKWKAC